MLIDENTEDKISEAFKLARRFLDKKMKFNKIKQILKDKIHNEKISKVTCECIDKKAKEKQRWKLEKEMLAKLPQSPLETQFSSSKRSIVKTPKNGTRSKISFNKSYNRTGSNNQSRNHYETFFR